MNEYQMYFKGLEHSLTKADKIADELGHYIDYELPYKICHFLSTFCIQSKHPWTGKPLSLMPWQKQLILRAYGYRNPDGSLRFRHVYVFTPKKSGKTSLLSGLGLYHLLQHPGSECYCIASTVEQAQILFNQSCDYIDNCPSLRFLKIRRDISLVQDEKRHSKFRVLSSTPEGKSGLNANWIALDETWEWNGTHAQVIYDRLCNAGMTRENPQLWSISHCQYEHEHLGYRLYQLALDIMDGKDERLDTLGMVYGLREDEEWTTEEQWIKAQPAMVTENLPTGTVTMNYYRQEYEKAKNSPLDAIRFKTFLLNMPVGHCQAWLDITKWRFCRGLFTEEDLHGYPAMIGLDMSRRNDLTCYVVAVKKEDDEGKPNIYLLPRFFSPKQLATIKSKTDHVPYLVWEQQGYIKLTEGDIIDPTAIRAAILEDAQKFNILEFRYDPYGATETIMKLQEEMDCEFLEVKQSFASMSPSTAYLERKMLDHTIRHAGHPILDWCVSVATCRSNNEDQIMLDKLKSNGRIDGIVASAIAMGGWLAYEDDTWDGPMVFV
jgi:phage terminase large subunit-like protein